MSPIRLLLPVAVYAAILRLSSLPAESFEGIDLPAAASYLVHLVEYTALGAALRWALDGMRRPAVVTLVIGLALAVADETFQSTVPGRHPSALDVLVDVVGVALGTFAIARLGRSARFGRGRGRRRTAPVQHR